MGGSYDIACQAIGCLFRPLTNTSETDLVTGTDLNRPADKCGICFSNEEDRYIYKALLWINKSLRNGWEVVENIVQAENNLEMLSVVNTLEELCFVISIFWQPSSMSCF